MVSVVTPVATGHSVDMLWYLSLLLIGSVVMLLFVCLSVLLILLVLHNLTDA